MRFKTRITLILDFIFQPVTQWLAFESAVSDIALILPPKRNEGFVTSVRKASKKLKRSERGAFVFDVYRFIDAGNNSWESLETAKKYWNIQTGDES